MKESKIIFTKRRIIILLVSVFIALLLGVSGYIHMKYKVLNVDVTGNIHYTDQEIKDMIMKDQLTHNSLILALKYKNKEIVDIPFIESMTVEVVAPDTIQILVYEKALAGAVEYLGNYVYFDREGIVVEISNKETIGIPQVLGLKFGSFALHEPLPVENEEIFGDILMITQLLSTNQISATKIYFDKAKNITLYFEETRVLLGTEVDLEEKVMLLKSILPNLEGKKGELHLENYDENIKNVTFEMD